jgi:hypothetical protein
LATNNTKKLIPANNCTDGFSFKKRKLLFTSWAQFSVGGDVEREKKCLPTFIHLFWVPKDANMMDGLKLFIG